MSMMTQEHYQYIKSREKEAMKNKHAQALGRIGGKVKSAKKAKASRLNGKKGGRPRTLTKIDAVV